MADGGSSKLLVKHLPSQLSVSDKTDLLKHFGAKEVICMEIRGKLVSISSAFWNATEVMLITCTRACFNLTSTHCFCTLA